MVVKKSIIITINTIRLCMQKSKIISQGNTYPVVDRNVTDNIIDSLQKLKENIQSVPESYITQSEDNS